MQLVSRLETSSARKQGGTSWSALTPGVREGMFDDFMEGLGWQVAARISRQYLGREVGVSTIKCYGVHAYFTAMVIYWSGESLYDIQGLGTTADPS